MPWTENKGWVRVHSITVAAFVSLLLVAASVWAITGITKAIIAERQAEIVENLKSNYADSPAFLVEQLFEMQECSIPLFVPGMPNPVCFPAGLFSFDPKNFPESFLKGLVYEPEHGSPVYNLRLREIRETREIEVLNADGKVFYVFKPRTDYDPFWLARRKNPEIFSEKCSPEQREFILECTEPSHVEMEISLIPLDYIEIYAEESIASLLDVLSKEARSYTAPSLTQKSVRGGRLMMRMAGAETNIVIGEIKPVSTGKLIRVDYPDTLTNRLEMMVCTNLMERHWWLAETNLVTAGTNTLTWVDQGATNGAADSNRFYWIGNTTDSDGDGVVDGREVIIYHSNPDSIDSDGDGLVDGFSGLVTTNTYPGGASTSGSIYVEGEWSWGTDSAKSDTDEDGMGDGWEVKNGHNPLDPNDPPNVAGAVFYSGRQTGTLWVVAVTDSNSWSTANCYTSAVAGFPVSYRIPDLEQTNYWIRSWLDSNGDGQTNAQEAQGSYADDFIVITNRQANLNITLADPDLDSDFLPDWWEIHWFGSATNYSGTADPDADEYSNIEEYDAFTCPTNAASHPWNVSGTVAYAGLQTGIVHVVACTNGTDWGWIRSDTLSNSLEFTITHLPPDANYWLRAWRDSDGDGLPTPWEAAGSRSSNPVFLDANLTGQDITLADPDNDGDGLMDWWEVLYGLDPALGGEDGAVAWWKLDEGTGTNVIDATANANNGTLRNSEGEWVLGVISNALSFNGTNSYVEVPDSASLKPEAVSVGMWITPSRLYTNGTAMFLSKRVPGGSAGYSLGYENGNVVFTFCSGGARSLGYSCALTSGVPIYVAGSFAGTCQTLFINGVQVASTNYNWGSGFGTVDQDTNVLRLGSASGATPTNFFSGTLDDVRVAPRGWSTNDVRAIWEIGADFDQDGLSNWLEYQLGTDPLNPDSDSDGLLDGAEALTYGSDPLSRDTDGDGLPDGWEAQYSAAGYSPVTNNAAPIVVPIGGFLENCVTVSDSTLSHGPTCTVTMTCSSSAIFTNNGTTTFTTTTSINTNFSIVLQAIATSSTVGTDTVQTVFQAGDWSSTSQWAYTSIALAGVTNTRFSATGTNSTNVVSYTAETIPSNCGFLIGDSLVWLGGGDPYRLDQASEFTTSFSPGCYTVKCINAYSAGYTNRNVWFDTIVKLDIKKVEFTSDHGVLTDYNTDYAGSGGTVYNPRGWIKGGSNSPITHVKDSEITVNVTYCVQPPGITFDLAGDGTIGALDFHKTGLTSSGSDQTVSITSDDNLPRQIDVLTNSIDWSIILNGNFSCYSGSSGPHKIYVTWGNPGIGPTIKRVDWACRIARAATSATEAAEKFTNSLAVKPGYAYPRSYNETSPWFFLDQTVADANIHADCITLATLAVAGLNIIGVPAVADKAWPTADGSTGFPALNETSCHAVARRQFQYQGESFWAKLKYIGNKYEGYFKVNDPEIKAYTIYTPGGPFSDSTYYALEVLQWAAGVGGDQYWVWDVDVANPEWPYETKNGVTVESNRDVPANTTPAPSVIPVPDVP